mgnify:CR=1 FL=1
MLIPMISQLIPITPVLNIITYRKSGSELALISVGQYQPFAFFIDIIDIVPVHNGSPVALEKPVVVQPGGYGFQAFVHIEDPVGGVDDGLGAFSADMRDGIQREVINTGSELNLKCLFSAFPGLNFTIELNKAFFQVAARRLDDKVIGAHVKSLGHILKEPGAEDDLHREPFLAEAFGDIEPVDFRTQIDVYDANIDCLIPHSSEELLVIRGGQDNAALYVVPLQPERYELIIFFKQP